jgi:hypothetical protein
VVRATALFVNPTSADAFLQDFVRDLQLNNLCIVVNKNKKGQYRFIFSVYAETDIHRINKAHSFLPW